MNRYASLVRRTPIARVSKKRKRENVIYLRLRAEFLEQRPVCEVCKCRPADHVHHRKGRYFGNFLDVTTWTAACFLCHDWIHRNPEQARELGLLQPSQTHL